MTKKAMKLALDVLTPDPEEAFWFVEKKKEKAITAIRKALAEQSAQKQEPVGKVNELFDEAVIEQCGFDRELLVYTSPPASKPWVGLTDEEINAALDYWSEDERSAYGGAHAADGEYVSMIDTWRYIEAKLKEKNT